MRDEEGKERGEKSEEKERGRRKWVSSFETQIYSIFSFSKKVSFFNVLRQTFYFLAKTT